MDSDVDRGQTPEDEAEDNLSRPRSRRRTKFRPRGLSGLEDLTYGERDERYEGILVPFLQRGGHGPGTSRFNFGGVSE